MCAGESVIARVDRTNDPVTGREGRPDMVMGFGVRGVGVDIVDIPRFRDMGLQWGERILDRLFTPQEQDACHGPSGYRWHSLAGRLAAKEATKKVLLARGLRAGSWRNIEIVTGSHGEPLVSLRGAARSAADQLGFYQFSLSISHEAHLAIAFVVAG
jgi:holo-[acyl-carrier protein] synthase